MSDQLYRECRHGETQAHAYNADTPLRANLQCKGAVPVERCEHDRIDPHFVGTAWRGAPWCEGAVLKRDGEPDYPEAPTIRRGYDDDFIADIENYLPDEDEYTHVAVIPHVESSNE